MPVPIKREASLEFSDGKQAKLSVTEAAMISLNRRRSVGSDRWKGEQKMGRSDLDELLKDQEKRLSDLRGHL